VVQAHVPGDLCLQLVRAKGDKAGASSAIFELREQQSNVYRWPFRLWKLSFARLEQQPFLILLPILISVSISTFIFDRAFKVRAIAPTNHEMFAAASYNGPFTIAYPRFNGFIYSLENTLPLVKLGMDDKWAPNPNNDSTNLLTKYEIFDRSEVVPNYYRMDSRHRSRSCC
jgi:hypothetical protein